MADRDSLYSVSPSPPESQHRPFQGTRSYKATDNAASEEATAELLKAMHEPAGKLRHPPGSSSAFQAPAAVMTSTAPQRQEFSFKKFLAPKSGGGNHNGHDMEDTAPSVVAPGSTKGMEQANLQAEVQEKDDNSDLGDPEWHETEGNEITVSSHKRKRDSELRQPVPVVKQSQTRNYFYANCTEETQGVRKVLIDTIISNWGSDSKIWMPSSILPYVSGKTGPKYERKRLKDPKDWNTPLLRELMQLSKIFQKQPQRARRALEEAVALAGRGHRCPQLIAADVAGIIQRAERASMGMSTPRAQPAVPVHATPQARTSQIPIHATPPPYRNEAGIQLPSPGMSPTSSPAIRIKQEGSPTATIRQNSVEGIAGSESEWREADIARKKRTRKLRDELKNIRLQKEELRLQRELRALGERDEVG